MSFTNTIFKILEEQNILKTTKTKPIVDAIKNRKKIDFYYSGPRKGRDSVKSGKRESAELVAMGLSKRGNLIVRAYVDTPSVSKKGFEKTNWRTFMVSRMSDVKISDEKFDQKRPDYEEGADMSMSVTYVTSDWTNKPEVKKPRIVKSKPEVPSATATTEPTPSVEPTTTTTTTPEEPKTTELPQPKPQTKPEKLVTPPIKQNPSVEPTTTTPEEPKTTELPQPKPIEKPVANPEEDEENKNLKESIKNIKRLMFL
jgi:hypothetical protein